MGEAEDLTPRNGNSFVDTVVFFTGEEQLSAEQRDNIRLDLHHTGPSATGAPRPFDNVNYRSWDQEKSVGRQYSLMLGKGVAEPVEVSTFQLDTSCHSRNLAPWEGRGDRGMMAGMPGFFTVFPLVFVVTFVLIISVSIFNLTTQIRRRRDLEQGRQNELLDARADAGRWIDRLSNEILHTTPEDEQVKKLVGQASERHASALRQAGSATTVGQAKLARDVAVEGLYYMRESRKHMGELEGPPLPELGS